LITSSVGFLRSHGLHETPNSEKKLLCLNDFFSEKLLFYRNLATYSERNFINFMQRAALKQLKLLGIEITILVTTNGTKANEFEQAA